MRIINRTIAFLLFLVALTGPGNAQNDTIWSRSGDMLIGEIKSLENGVLMFDAEYADQDFHIEWSEIRQLISERSFLIILTDGRRLNGNIFSHPGNMPRVRITNMSGVWVTGSLLDITSLTPVEKTFLGRLDASIELGFNLTKANNVRQFTTRSYLGYTADIWRTKGSLDVIRSSQDSVAPTKRTDGMLEASIFFNRSWFLSLSNNFLQNDEQLLKLRSTTNLSVGHLLINTHRAYWGVGIGSAYNFESFTSEDPVEKSIEALVATELNLFAYDDLSLNTSLRVYPSISVRRRVRSDIKFDLKYDLPLDFFIKLGFTHNYDNQPVEGASTGDYIIQTTFGWEL
jgi:hypothetical protein